MVALIPALERLRADVDYLAPHRKHASDGWIGDTAHQETVSDHNDDETGNVPIHDADLLHEVHAVDVDSDLGEPGLTMEMVVQHTLTRCRSGAEDRLRYVIYYRRWWQASHGWVEQPYTGPSPHTEHAHFSGSYTTSREADTRSWRLEDIPVALTAADKAWIAQQLSEIADKVALVPADTVNRTFDRQGIDEGGTTSLRATAAWSDSNIRRVEGKVDQVLARVPAPPAT